MMLLLLVSRKRKNVDQKKCDDHTHQQTSVLAETRVRANTKSRIIAVADRESQTVLAAAAASVSAAMTAEKRKPTPGAHTHLANDMMCSLVGWFVEFFCF